MPAVKREAPKGRGLPGTGKRPWFPRGQIGRAVSAGLISYEKAYKLYGPKAKKLKPQNR
jgi:hypothetical protein